MVCPVKESTDVSMNLVPSLAADRAQHPSGPPVVCGKGGAQQSVECRYSFGFLVPFE